MNIVQLKKEACEQNNLKLKTDGNPDIFILFRYVKNGKIYSACETETIALQIYVFVIVQVLHNYKNLRIKGAYRDGTEDKF